MSAQCLNSLAGVALAALVACGGKSAASTNALTLGPSLSDGYLIVIAAADEPDADSRERWIERQLVRNMPVEAADIVKPGNCQVVLEAALAHAANRCRMLCVKPCGNANSTYEFECRNKPEGRGVPLHDCFASNGDWSTWMAR